MTKKRGVGLGSVLKGYQIPAQINETEFVEFCMRLPADLVYQDIFWEHLRKLSYWHSWEHPVKTGTLDTRAGEVSRWWHKNVYLPNRHTFDKMEGCGCEDTPVKSYGDCVSYKPLLQYLDFYPSSPYDGRYNPPPKWAQNPWLVSKGNELTGLEPGDVYATVDNLMAGVNNINLPLVLAARLAAGGFPRFEFTFTGRGEVELHLLNVPQGGLFLIRDKAKITSARIAYASSISAGDVADWIEALQAILGLVLTGGIFPEQIIEMQFPEQGTHTIEVVLLPRVSFPNFLNTGWGGGIRKIVVCGKQVKPKSPPPPVIRPGNGEVEYEDPNTGEWLPIPDSGYMVDDCGCSDSPDDLEDNCECEEC